MTISKVAVDLRARTFSVEVPDDKLDSILDRLEQIFDGYNGGEEADNTPPRVALPNEMQPSEAATPNRGTRKRGRSSSGGKLKSWQIVDLGLDEDQRAKLRQFFADKAPKGQGEEVAVISAKLSEMTGSKTFNGYQIHSALKIVDRPTPKNLTAVFGNMKRDGLGDYKGLDLIVNHYTEDYVKFKLPKTSDKKK